MPPPIPNPIRGGFKPSGPPLEMLSIELLYFLIIVGCCIFIYYKTKEAYELTKHKGIYYFRHVFLYFALTYFFRIIHVTIQVLKDLMQVHFPREIHIFTFAFISYFSTLAIFSLAATIFTRKLNFSTNNLNLLMHVVAIISTVIVFSTKSNQLLVLIQTIFFLVMIVLMFIATKPSKIVSFNKLNYLSLFVFWVINVFAFTRLFRVPQIQRITLYIVSIAIFVWVVVRVVKRLQ